MNRLILRFLNLPSLVLLTAIAVAIQTSLFSSWPLSFFMPDAILLVVIWCALRRDFTEGGIITLIVSEIAELHSSVPSGIFLISYMALYLLLRAADKMFVLPTEFPMAKVTLSSSAFWKISTIVILTLMSSRRHLWEQMISSLVPGAVMASILGAWVYPALEKFDLATFKNASAENPDEFQIENLGL